MPKYCLATCENSPLTLTSTVSAETCDGLDGAIVVTVSGGSNNGSNYTYSWTEENSSDVLSTTNSLTDLSIGNYELKVTDTDLGCELTKTFEILDGCTSCSDNPVVISNSSVVAQTCDTEGSVSIVVAGGSGDYTYEWSSGEIGTLPSTTSIVGGVADTYTVTVTDNNVADCEVIQSFTIVKECVTCANSPLTLTSTVSAETCDGLDGAIVVTVSGGSNNSSNYTYSWTEENSLDVLSTTNSLSDLSIGNYELTVTDTDLGCELTRSFEVLDGCISCSDDPVVITSSSVVAQTCNAEGSVSIAVSGGSGDYTYTWSSVEVGVLSSTTNTVGGVAGTYTVTVTDNNVANCQVVQSFTVENNPLTISSVVTDQDCNESSGSIVVSVSNGSGNYTYNWSGGSSSANQLTGAAATYTLTVTDNVLGCTKSTSIEIKDVCDPVDCNSTPLVLANTLVTDKDCDDTQGSIRLQVDGNNSYDYTWTRTDGTGGFSVNNNGNVTILTGVVGTYTVLIEDIQTGCTFSNTYQIKDVCVDCNATPLTLSQSSVVGVNCLGEGGQIKLTVAPGSGSYTYNWAKAGGATDFTEANNANETILSGGTGIYTVTITDNVRGCTFTNSYTIPNACGTVDCDANPLQISDVIVPLCTNPGSITVTVTNGSGNYDYIWGSNDTNDFEENGNILNGGVGNYSLTVTDLATNCEVTATYAIVENCFSNVDCSTVSPLVFTELISTNPDCSQSNGTINVEVSGGSGNYNYEWSDYPPTQSFDNSPNLDGLAAGSYLLTVKDETCSSLSPIYTFPLIELTESCGGAAVPLGNHDIRIYPNPAGNRDILNVEYLTDEPQETMSIYNSFGVLVDKINVESQDGFVKTQIKLDNMESGVYYLKTPKRISKRFSILE